VCVHDALKTISLIKKKKFNVFLQVTFSINIRRRDFKTFFLYITMLCIFLKILKINVRLIKSLWI